MKRLQTNIYVCYQPSVIACAAIYLASRKLGISLCMEPEWYLIFDTCLEDLQNIAGSILKLYSRPVWLLKEVEKEINRLYDRR
jgi:transcription initiation factor TFIIIB Brf1 subunit/transcription initiation factor TFIIB